LNGRQRSRRVGTEGGGHGGRRNPGMTRQSRTVTGERNEGGQGGYEARACWQTQDEEEGRAVTREAGGARGKTRVCCNSEAAERRMHAQNRG